MVCIVEKRLPRRPAGVICFLGGRKSVALNPPHIFDDIANCAKVPAAGLFESLVDQVSADV